MSPKESGARVQMSSVAVVGAACRLPGAKNEAEFWQLLEEGRCSVGSLPEGRWRPERYQHPRTSEPGFSYTFDGGYIDDPLGFDPMVFGISPREAAEMDPQQRLLLEVVWGALENSGLPPSALAGANVGVYVGASSLDYGNLHTTDTAAIESHFMTGNTLSILSNRISYIFDLRGPSFTIDTACSSSLVAFSEAQSAISSGRIDMAIVAGVNLLMSPTSFIGFSRASMLSPTGLCRPFSAQADGYVRAEGAVAMVLAKLETAVERHYPVRAVALASGINSDGKTNGISLPSAEGQRELLDRLYGHGAIDTRRLAFVEAHGTGTRVGDPAEASAIGEALGRGRDKPLPIGSVKSNIGHLEPASGLAGLLKAILALEHRRLPASLHLDAINPSIDFAALNLSVATEAVTLPQTGTWLAGVSSFGFGGTNAHVVIRQPEPGELPTAYTNGAAGRPAELLVLSAHSRPALGDTAAAYASFIETGIDTAAVASAVAWQRDLAGHRLALPVGDAAQMAASLRNFAETGNLANGVIGQAPSSAPKVCFVFSGNGCQWAGMGRVAFAGSEAFRRHFRGIDEIFGRLSDWSLVEALHDEAGLAERLKKTRIAQPLLFAVQAALTASLAEWGLKPDMALGHSVGEVAAAQATGALGLAEAVHVIFHRSEHQETVFGRGGMAVGNLSKEDALALIASSGLDGLEIAAINSPTSVTISGPDEAIREFSRVARKRRVAVRVLDLAYPFHSALLEPLHLPLLDSLGDFATGAGEVPFISTVTGDVIAGETLDREYWWRNVREPVRFQDAIEAAGRQGATLFIEIGPRPILAANMGDTLREAGLDGSAIASLVEKEAAGDPLAAIAARAMVLGCKLDTERLFGSQPVGAMQLPAYAWQRKVFQQPQTTEAMELYGDTARHPLIGARLMAGTPEWRNLIDATVVPYLVDHRIDDEIIVPGSAFAEMALAVGREIFPEGPIGLEDFDLMQWMPLQPDAMRELSVRLSDTHVVEIWSRPRLGADEWTLHARGRIIQIVSPAPGNIAKPVLPRQMSQQMVYDAALATGVSYGPAFQRVLSAERSDTIIEVELSPYEENAGTASRRQILHPIALDSAFHAMFDNIKPRENERYAYLPVRFASLRVDQDHGVPARAHIVVDRETDESLSISVWLYDADGAFVAGLTGGLFRAVTLDRRGQTNAFFQQRPLRIIRHAGESDARAMTTAALQAAALETPPDSWLFLGAFARSLAHQALRATFGQTPILAGSAQTIGTVDEALLPLVFSLLDQLRIAGLATETPEGWVLAAESDLPEPTEILQSFAADFSDASPEIVLAAQALGGLEHALKTGEPVQIRTAIQEQFEKSSILFQPVLASALAVCEALQVGLAPDPIRVLVAEPFCLGVLECLAPLVREGRALVTVIGVDAKRLHHTAARYGATDGITFLEVDGDADTTAEAAFDLAFGFAYGTVFDGDPALGRVIARRLVPDGQLCVLLPPDNGVFDLLLGTGEGWFANSIAPQFPVGRVSAAQESGRLLIASGFSAIETSSLGDGIGSVLVAKPDARAETVTVASAPLLLVESPSLVVSHLMQVARAEGRTVRTLAMDTPADFAPAWRDLTAGVSPNDTVDLVFPVDGLDRSIARLAAILDVVQTGKCRLWVLTRGLDSASADAIDPVAEAVWCFARVAMNEYASVELKLVDVAMDLDADAAARQLAALIAAPGADAELLIDGSGVRATRTVAGLQTAGAGVPVESARLSLRSRGLQAKFDWIETARRAPGPTEVEIEIAAAGLNFRDVMLATGLLDDDVLDDGLAGAVFGFECAGRVVRVGSDVTHLAAGDAVMGFGRESFATHSTADAAVFTKVPEGLSVEAAATIPVAFLTAWYSLVHQAQIQPGEWVLIHGAAGGVGLAAIQIARLRGARVAATVSSPDKRALVELFGAEKVYNSRSTAFLDAIKADIGGVDIVLNSLAGEAMQASIKCLKPFGRFVEMGKRDYVLNTAMGLRPFRRNLTYFGVDLDQLLAANLPLANRLMGDLVQHFESGEFLPLPHRAFDWYDVGKAFQLMQAAGHVGKLIVKPAEHPIATNVASVPFKPGAGAHLVVGGAGGFGFEAASWLAERGAKTIVVASRRGQIEPHLRARVAAIRAAGTTLIVESLDVTDANAVTSLVGQITRSHGRLAGVIHTAMVLDDGMIAGMEPARTRAVLAPKVEGADNLDRATRGAPLDYFVAFSSATTMVGNPGQGAYVAANGYLQGLMRRRRAEGLAGLAVGWGAIADVGILSRNQDVAAKLERISGIVALQSKEALGYLDTMLSRGADCPPIVHCAIFRPGAALQSLKLLQTPAYAQLFAGAEGGEMAADIDLAAQIAGKSEGEARTIVAGLVASEVARIFRLSAEEIDVTRPLDELGMDSMMSLDLRMGIEKRFSVELPVVAISAGVSVNDLASRLITGLRSDGGGKSAGDAEQQLIQQHGGDVDVGELMAFTDAIKVRNTEASLL